MPSKSSAGLNIFGILAGSFLPSGMRGTVEFSEDRLQRAERPRSQEGGVNLLKKADPRYLIYKTQTLPE